MIIRKKKYRQLLKIIEKLWSIIDDIDTYGDMAKSDDKLYRKLVERKHKERFNLGITSDGYSLYLNGKKIDNNKASDDNIMNYNF